MTVWIVNQRHDSFRSIVNPSHVFSSEEKCYQFFSELYDKYNTEEDRTDAVNYYDDINTWDEYKRFMFEDNTAEDIWWIKMEVE